MYAAVRLRLSRGLYRSMLRNRRRFRKRQTSTILCYDARQETIEANVCSPEYQVMPECRCGSFVSTGRRTCSVCGHMVNSAGQDPPVQKEARPGATLANLRLENLRLQTSVEQHENAERLSADRAALLQQSLIEIGAECEDLRRTLELTRQQVHGLDDRLLQLRNRLESLGISTHIPIVATQASMPFGELVPPTDSTSTKDPG